MHFMKLRYWFVALWLICITTATGFAQNFTISGFVEDNANGEKLIGANVYDAASFKGTTTNAYGFFSLTLPQGEHTIAVSFVGFEKQQFSINLSEDVTMNIKLRGLLELKEFEITGDQTEKIQEQSQMSRIDVPVTTINKIPALLGERDVLKALQLLPGVQSGSEGTSGIYVRGGGPDQNLILLDGVPVYNASHLFGFFSVFNTDAINSVELIKGGFPAHYGGRLSSVIDIRMKEGNMNEFHGSGSVGIVASKLTLEGPIIKDKASFIVSGRRTYIDILTRPLIKRQFSREGIDGVAGYYFYDLNGKVNYKISEKDRIYLSSYLGDDNFYFDFNESSDISPTQTIAQSQGAGLRWGNITTAVRYNRVLNKKMFMNVTGTYSRYNFNVGQTITSASDPVDPAYAEDIAFEYKSGIFDWSGRVDFDYIPSPNHFIKFGGGDIYHTFVPGITVFDASFGNSEPIDTTFGATPVYAHEYFAYVEDDFKIGTRLKMNLGLHFSGFKASNENYVSLQPRASARYLLTEFLSVKASYAQMQQYIHLLTNASIGLPTDLWVPSTDIVKPEDSRQVAAGVAYTFLKKYELSVEGYYKTMTNLIEYKEGAGFFTTGASWEDQITFGDGWSYGGEIFLQKKVGKTTGWVGYTLSWTTRQFEDLNFGEAFPYRYDRRHDLSIVMTHEFNEKMDIAATWVYGTGNAVSLPISRYASPSNGFFGNEIYNYGSRNSFRMAAYHRMDIGMNFHKERKLWKRTWSVGAYNAYSRKNPFFLYFKDEFTTDENGNTVTVNKLIQVSLFPIVPYVSYSFEF